MKNYTRLVGSGVQGIEMEIPETKKPEPQGGIPWSVTWDPLGFDWHPEREVLVDYSWFFDGLWVNIPFGVFVDPSWEWHQSIFLERCLHSFHPLNGPLTEGQRVLIRVPKPKSIKSSLGYIFFGYLFHFLRNDELGRAKSHEQIMTTFLLNEQMSNQVGVEHQPGR